MVTQGAHQLFQPRGFLAAAGELVHSGRKDGFVQQLLLVGSATRVTLGTKWAWRGLVGAGDGRMLETSRSVRETAEDRAFSLSR